MDPKHLVQLATILEKGSISRASAYLHLTQPTLTHNMQILESCAGAQLFERGRYGVRSTVLGEMLAREGRAIARRLEDAAQVMALHRSKMRDQLRIGMGSLLGAAVMADLALSLGRDFPAMALQVHNDSPHLLVEQLMQDQHDIIIAPSWHEHAPLGLERSLLVHDDLGLFCGQTHGLAGRSALRSPDFESCQWLSLSTASPFAQGASALLTQAGVPLPQVQLTVRGSALTLLDVLASGQHLSVLPRAPMRRLGPRFGIVELPLPCGHGRRDIYLWHRSTARENKVHARAVDLLATEARRLLEGEGQGPGRAAQLL